MENPSTDMQKRERLVLLEKPKQGEVWRVNLDPGVGSEMGKTRPCVVLSSPGIGVLPLCIIVPITNWNPAFTSYLWMTWLDPGEVNGLTKPSGADGFQVRSVSHERFVNKIGEVSAERLRRIEETIQVCIETR